VTNFDTRFNVPEVGSVGCLELELGAKAGTYPPLVCTALATLQAQVLNVCGCEDNPVCNICGDNREVTNDNAVVPFPVATDGSTCKELEDMGKARMLSPTECTTYSVAISIPCGCQSTGGGGGGGRFPCFSGEMAVELVDQEGSVPIDSIKIGDYVRVSNDENNGRKKYSQVYSLMHYDKTLPADYLQLYTEKSINKPLEISSQHMVFILKEDNKRVAVQAHSVKVGDRLVLAPLDWTEEAGAQVTRIDQVWRRGAYAPLTMSGDVVVNGVVASSYVSFMSDKERAFWGDDWYSPHFMFHAFKAPHRMVCRWFPGVCRRETYDANGISNWVASSEAFAHWFGQWPVWTQIVFHLATIPILLTVYWLEQVTLMSPLAWNAVWLIVYLVLKKRRGQKNKTKSA
jgi:hypothetical protein